ncbi:hypothetical protein [Maricaulis salignorans]|uniref:Uncharacterized protein n=1 Tax=Maricaulis salignorans TaxID=144026 RepID=A0A1G9RZB1_9PROT|nr:hypothetical protein [Maricaulis salignorans]SDM28628.1 hypothetical protein SAMN04488568_10856 [Maricaulis salignorans]
MEEHDPWRPYVRIESVDPKMSWGRWAGVALGVTMIIVLIVLPVWMAKFQAALVPCGELRTGLVELSALRIDSASRGSIRRTWTTRVRFPEGDSITLRQSLPNVHRGDRVTLQDLCHPTGGNVLRQRVNAVEHIGH